jgi:hypothetical protein
VSSSFDVSGRRLAVACLIVAGGLAGCGSAGAGFAGQGAVVPTMTAADPTAGEQPAATDTAASSTASPASVSSVDTEVVATDPPAETSAPSVPTGSAAPDGAAPGRPRPVTVTTTYAGVLTGGSAVEVGGFIDVVESDGTCTLVLRRGATTRQVSAAATPDPTGTSCGGLAVELSELTSGTWSGVLGYRSSRSVGTAPAVDVEVP